MNDIGESLQSEELRGAEEGGKKSRTIRRFLFLVAGKKVQCRASMVEKSQRSDGSSRSHSVIVTPKEYMLVFMPPTLA